MIADLVAGYVGGVCGIAVGYPLDSVKVRAQLNPHLSTMDLLRDVRTQGGLLRLFDGLASPISSYGILIALNFGVQGAAARKLAQALPSDTSAYTIHALAGFASGAVLSVASSPFELVKIRMQAASQAAVRPFASTLECARALHRHQGTRGFFRGHSLQANFVALSVGSAVYFSTYALLSDTLVRWQQGEPLSFAQSMAMGGVTGIVYWCAIFPLDVAKSRIMQATVEPGPPRYRGVAHALHEIWRTAGARGLYRGIGVACIRGVPVNAVMLSVNAQVKAWM